MKLADAPDSKSGGLILRAGSTPAFGTKTPRTLSVFEGFCIVGTNQVFGCCKGINKMQKELLQLNPFCIAKRAGRTAVELFKCGGKVKRIAITALIRYFNNRHCRCFQKLA